MAFTPDYGMEYVIIQLIEKSPTKITIFEVHENDPDFPFGDAFEFWIMWEAMTMDPDSRQTVFRKQYRLKWLDRPGGFIAGKIQGGVTDGNDEFNSKFAAFF